MNIFSIPYRSFKRQAIRSSPASACLQRSRIFNTREARPICSIYPMETILPNSLGCTEQSFASIQERISLSWHSAAETAVHTWSKSSLVSFSWPAQVSPAWNSSFRALCCINAPNISFNSLSFCLQELSFSPGIHASSSSEPALIITGGSSAPQLHTCKNILENSSKRTSPNVSPNSRLITVNWQISTRISIPDGIFSLNRVTCSIPGSKR